MFGVLVFPPNLTSYSTTGNNKILAPHWKNPNSIKVTISGELTVMAYFVWNTIPILAAKEKGWIFKEHLLFGQILQEYLDKISKSFWKALGVL